MPILVKGILIIYLLITDLNELTLPKTCTTEFPDPDDLLNFKLTICPDEVSDLIILIWWHYNIINFITRDHTKEENSILVSKLE